MPIPYNIWGGDILWMVLGGSPKWQAFMEDTGFYFFRGFMPPEEKGELWKAYYWQGVPGYPETRLPWLHPCPPEWGAWADRPNKWRQHAAWTYDYVHNVLLSFLLYGGSPDIPGAWPGHDYEGYKTGISVGLDGGQGEWVIWDTTNNPALAQDTGSGLEVLTPGSYEVMDILFITEDGKTPLLVVHSDQAWQNRSWDYGENWEELVWADEYPDSPWDGGCYTYSDYAVQAGLPGKGIWVVCGGNDVWRAVDFGRSMHICYAPSDHGGEGKWVPSSAPAIVGDTYCVGFNQKRDPDSIWMLPSYYALDSPEHMIQRNITEDCEPDGWEGVAHFAVSQEYQDDIYLSSCFYPPDYPTEGLRGDPLVEYFLPTAIKFLPGTERWWIFSLYHRSDMLIFSDDDGLTWSNVLADHTGANNEFMHPFFSPARWPWSWNYDYYLTTNSSGRGYLYDIIEHPDDPQIVVSLGEPWWKADFEVGDPCDRWDGTFHPVRKTTLPETEFLKYPQYHGGDRFLHPAGYEECCLCISHDGGNTWGRPFSVAPNWDLDQCNDIPVGRRLYTHGGKNSLGGQLQR